VNDWKGVEEKRGAKMVGERVKGFCGRDWGIVWGRWGTRGRAVSWEGEWDVERGLLTWRGGFGAWEEGVSYLEVSCGDWGTRVRCLRAHAFSDPNSSKQSSHSLPLEFTGNQWQ